MRANVMRLAGCVALGLMVAGAGPAPEPGEVTPKAAGPLLVDGRCTDAAWADAERRMLGHGTDVRFLADAHFVYVCVSPPADSFATLDLFFQTGDGQALNLHASAQLGERVKSGAAWPDFEWGNNARWTGNTNRYVDYDRERGRVRFAYAEGRELQIDRSLLGRGVVPMMAVIQQIRTPDGMATLRFPANADEDNQATWGTLRLD